MDLLESLNWRYATKKYSQRQVSAATLDTILEAVSLSASSGGLQPYRLVVVENPELRQKLQEGSFNPQISEASHLVVFVALEKLNLDYIESYVAYVAQQRGIPVASLDGYKTSLVNNLQNRTDEANYAWATNQAYLGLGTALIAAADLRVDATPMEGFNAAKFDELLQLKEKGLRAVVCLALGYRDEQQDIFAKFKKVRLPREEFVTVQ